MLRSLLFKFFVLLSVFNSAAAFAQVNTNEGLLLVYDYIKETCPGTIANLNDDEDYKPFLRANLLNPDLVCACTNNFVMQDSKLNTMANDVLKPPKKKQNEEFVRRYMVTRVQQAMFACIASALEERMKSAGN